MRKSGYDFYLDKCLLPVTPSKLEIKINNANKTMTLINEGEINILKKAELSDIEFECEIPQVKQPYAVYPTGFKAADYFLNYFETLKLSNKPFQFIVCRQMPNGKKFFNTNIKVSLEDYKIIEDAKEGFDLKVRISLKQYKDYGTKLVNITFAENKPKASIEACRETTNSPAPTQNEPYEVKPGDCLWNIAKKQLGDGTKYKEIAKKNGISDPNRIYPGQVLKL